MAGIARMHSVVLDCPDPRALSEFYAALVGWETVEADDEWVAIADERGIELAFQRVEDFRPPVWPGQAHPQQFHIDVQVDDFAKAEAAVTELGAVKHEHQPGEESGFIVFLDPVGHPFCLCLSGGE
ncbi:VOC family protein [Microbispora sp. RL4-1S]|uniref:VOC family protein n=1 Tax=Microbispora oryzae TaxID=2806554 RepID=A0A941ARS4_9ACTN|nr:VOC family protein [Microbispora oryzae]MBP2706589.1 VOC family protein [Microbispora oryzae]